MDYQKTILSNGLRILYIPRSDSPSVTAMVLVGVGSRHENDQEAGISHFIEHNVFKGTKKRPRRNQISEEIEGLGGVTNAATGREFTYYWAKAAVSRLDRILDIVMDISLNMTFPQQDLEIERGNVIEEINMYQDNPAQRLGRDFLEFVWGGHPVGRNIAGTRESVMSITRGQMVDYVENNYTPENLIVVVAGQFDQAQIEAQVKSVFDKVPSSRAAKKINQYQEFQKAPGLYLDNDKTNQTHFAIGIKTFERNHQDRYVLDLTNAILGEGMSSRLFKKIREELGLAYYVGSTNFEFDDTGIWLVRAGIDSARVHQAIEVTVNEIKELAQEKVKIKELIKAKEFIKGRTLLGVETSEELGSWYAFQELLEVEILTPVEYNQRIDAVTADQIQQLVEGLLKQERLNLGVIGPHQGRDRFLEHIKI